MENMTWLTPLIMLLFGIAVKRFPFLAGLPNQMIPILNLVIGILIKLVTPVPAEAGGFFSAAAGVLGWLWPPVQVIVARLLYETFVRPTEELAGVGPIHTPGKVAK